MFTITAYLGCLPSLLIWDVELIWYVKVIMAYLEYHRHYRS